MEKEWEGLMLVLVNRLEQKHGVLNDAIYQKILAADHAEILRLTGFSNAELPAKLWNSLHAAILEDLNNMMRESANAAFRKNGRAS